MLSGTALLLGKAKDKILAFLGDIKEKANEDDILVDEDIISQHLESDLDLLAATLAADKTLTNLDEDDKELAEFLRELKSDQKEEDSQKADSNSSQTSRNSPKIPSQTKSIGSKNSQKSDSSADSLILSQHLSQMSKEKYESEVNETLEMTKVGNIWFLSPLVLSKWEDLAFSVSILFEECVFIF